QEDRHGSERAGLWNDKDFVIRSGVILCLAAQEAFERDVIRILVSHGKKPAPRKMSDADALFQPALSDLTRENRPWEEVEEATWSGKGRQSLFIDYALNPRPPHESARILKLAWQDRNRLAHGRERVDLSLYQVLQVHHAVFCAMDNLAQECRKKQGIEI